MSLLDAGFHIRLGTVDDMDVLLGILRQQERLHKGCLGFPPPRAFRDALEDRRVHVALLADRIVGLVEYWRRRDGIQTIYHLAVLPEAEGDGVGRNLLYSVECPIRLKCPQVVNKDEENPANKFYAHAGLICTSNDERLNTWELPILPILVQGTNREMPRIARETGWAYGVRAIEKPRDWCFQVDLEFSEDWRSFDWQTYIEQIRAWKPVAALALDYFEPAQLPTLLAQIDDLRAAGVMRVLVCPKFHGAVKDIPTDCIVAISIPSSYAGFVPHFSELRGRKVHLLGGSPPKWFGSQRSQNNATGYIAAVQGAGATIISVDGNAHTARAEQGAIWRDCVWDFSAAPVDLYGFMVESGNNIRRDLHKSASVQQLSMELL
jgi:GNAT superfamily N-acetyltransferase